MHFTAHFFTAFYQKEAKRQGMKVQVKPALKNINVCHHCRQAFLGIFLTTGLFLESSIHKTYNTRGCFSKSISLILVLTYQKISQYSRSGLTVLWEWPQGITPSLFLSNTHGFISIIFVAFSLRKCSHHRKKCFDLWSLDYWKMHFQVKKLL